MKANLKNGWRVEYSSKQMVVRWFSNPVRVAFSEENNEWYFALVDVCRAVGIQNNHDVTARMDPKRLHKFKVASIPPDIDKGVDIVDITSAPNPQITTFCDEFSVYCALFTSNKLEARQFREWTFEIIRTLRKKEGIATYNLGKLLEKETQDQILDHVNKAKYEGWDMYYDKVTDWWWIEKMTGGGDIMFVPVDDPYGRPFKWLDYDPTYEPSFDTNDPDIKRPCPYYN